MFSAFGVMSHLESSIPKGYNKCLGCGKPLKKPYKICSYPCLKKTNPKVYRWIRRREGARKRWHGKAGLSVSAFDDLNDVVVKLLGTKCKVCGQRGSGRYGLSGLVLHHRWYGVDSDKEASTPQRRWEAIQCPKLFAHLCRKCHGLVHGLEKLANTDQTKAIKLARELKQNWGVHERKRLDEIEMKRIRLAALEMSDDIPNEIPKGDDLPEDAVIGVYDQGL